MEKLATHYSIEISRKKLTDKFNDTMEVMNVISSMPDCDLSVLAAMVDGKSITNPGYDQVNADYSAIRLSATLGRLRYHFPITCEDIECLNELGKETKRSKYLIKPNHLDELLTNPLDVLHRCEHEAWKKKTVGENHDIKRLIQRYGEPIAAKRLIIQAYKDLNLTNTQWGVILASIDDVCDTLEQKRKVN